MNKSILYKWLHKQGIENLEPQSEKNPKGISLEELQTFDKYQKILSKEIVTIEDIKLFLKQQLNVIDQKFKNLDVSNDRKAELIPYYNVYSSFLVAIDAPIKEREILENYLIQLTA